MFSNSYSLMSFTYVQNNLILIVRLSFKVLVWDAIWGYLILNQLLGFDWSRSIFLNLTF